MSETNIPISTQNAVGSPAREERIHIHVPDRHNPLLQRFMETVRADDELYTLWYCQNVNAVTRLAMTDHGPVHMQIIANSALRLLRLLMSRGVVPGVVRDHGLTEMDAEVIVVAASLLHDLGISIHRSNHEEYSLFLADRKLGALLTSTYPDVITRTIVQSEILHAIIAHRKDGKPLTIEAGVVRVADALDMASGRSRIPFEQGSTSIHSVSAMSIESVHIEEGAEKPVLVSIRMTHSAGVFQIDSLLREKLKGSGLEPYVEVVATIVRDTEAPLVQVIRL
ncbi:MAG: HD domain-containing protein [Caldilineales bacterium]|nr:HD domain-containing protein [Caldilineales bacterium]